MGKIFAQKMIFGVKLVWIWGLIQNGVDSLGVGWRQGVMVKSSSWDRLGISLSVLCAVHCALLPLAIFFLPVFSSFFASAWVHPVLSIVIVPTGLFAFILGYRHHRKNLVLWLGLPGLFLVGIFPLLEVAHSNSWLEPALMIPASLALVAAHLLNRKYCLCHDNHDH